MNFLKKLLLKSKCLYCNRNSISLLCESCINQIQLIPENSCDICKSTKLKNKSLSFNSEVEPQGILKTNNICFECSERPRLFKKLITIGVYNGILKNSIYRLKYEAEKDFSKVFGLLLSKELLKNKDIKVDYVTSIPLHKNKLKERGFNQAELIARNFSIKSNLSYLEIFDRVIYTKPQYTLNLQEREDNLKEAFSIKTKKSLKNKNIILIDDIFTTGTTINEACKLLLSNDVKDIYILSVARSLV